MHYILRYKYLILQLFFRITLPQHFLVNRNPKGRQLSVVTENVPLHIVDWMQSVAVVKNTKGCPSGNILGILLDNINTPPWSMNTTMFICVCVLLTVWLLTTLDYPSRMISILSKVCDLNISSLKVYLWQDYSVSDYLSFYFTIVLKDNSNCQEYYFKN